ncbi:MAG: hypothetical protein FWH26_04485 [Oscillospiraceae bacterium]|nr:hypothetical protein [Oscillospiraceae bacterium]
MKYLKDEFCSHSEFDKHKEKLWDTALQRYWKEFLRIKHKFPKEFIAEITEGRGFHDSFIKHIAIDENKPGEYSLKLVLSYDDIVKPQGEMQIIMRNISNLKLDDIIGQYWTYNEFLPKKKGRLSLEVKFSPNEGFMYVEFESLEYFCKPAGTAPI